ncbi:alanine racemase [Streptomyces sp. AM 4-1-1]|uniref:alanine racemase n=1 Tax=unclassified Streptomyces TaxID=2593676 RepID=UPI0023B9A903|nr:alanine racemase [Streptomyces sp. AM 4-1-1]WEH37230.1 alanine racemase [Streptomyces sp. AM 4-1-1]
MPVPDPRAGLPDLPTPVYLYDLAHVRANHRSLRDALPAAAGLYYSLKANPHPAVLSQLRTLGARAEVCSTGELHAALDAGWRGADILYTGPGKRDDEIREALEHGVCDFSVDSPYALDQLDRLAADRDLEARCLLRVNDDQPVPGQGLVMTGVTSQFGADTGWILDEPQRFASRAHARVSGLHLYMGTNLTGTSALLGQFARAVATAKRLSDALTPHGVRLETLDLGGGFGAPFAKEGSLPDLTGLRQGLEDLLDAEVTGWRDGAPEVVFESGRYLVGTAGKLLTTTLDVKSSQGKDVVILESGINHLGGMSGMRRLPPLNPSVLGPSGSGEEMPDALLTGPLCTPLDTWSRSAPLPAVRPGDVLCVPNVGAYGLYASLVAFLGHPLPAEAVLDSDRPDAGCDITRLALTRTLASKE